MRKFYLLSLVLFAGIFMSQAQDAVLIIDEDFQGWPATEGVVSDPPADCESFNHIAGPDKFDLFYETGGSGKVSLIKYLISPECNSKRVNQGESASNAIDVTTGFVGLTKTQEEGDTIGEMLLPKLSNVTEIEFGYSCTSSDRGIRLYTSTDDGTTWEGPWTIDGPGVGEIIGSDTKLGEMVVLPVNLDNVILKFTAGVDSDGVSQNSRIHNIKIWGVPGAHETGIEDAVSNTIFASYVGGTGLVVRGEILSLQIYNLEGKKVFESFKSGDQIIQMEDLPDGIYLLNAEDRQQKTFTKKFLKQD